MYLQEFIVQHLMLETYNLKYAVARESSEKQKQYIKVFFFFFNCSQRQFLITVMV